MNRYDLLKGSQRRLFFSGCLHFNYASRVQGMDPVRYAAVMILAAGWLCLSSIAVADVLVDQSLMLGQSVEGNSHLLSDRSSNFAVHIEKGFVKLNLADRIDLTEGSSLSSSLCFYSDMGKGEYRVSASSWHELHDGQMVFRSESDDIPYAMTIGGDYLDTGNDAHQSSSLGAPDRSCLTGDQASLTLSVDRSLLPDLWRGSYTDTITLLVHPE